MLTNMVDTYATDTEKDTVTDTSVMSNTNELADKIVSKLARNSDFKTLLADLMNHIKGVLYP